MTRRDWIVIVISVALGALNLAPAQSESPSSPDDLPLTTQRYEHDGIAVEFALRPYPEKAALAPASEAGDVVAEFHVSEMQTGQPIVGLQPRAWMSRRMTPGSLNDRECRAKIQSFLGGRMVERPDIDMGQFRVVTLNSDGTVLVINPQIAWSKTKYEAVVALPGKGHQWAIGPDEERLYITMPTQSAVAVIDTTTWRLIATIPMPSLGSRNEPARPTAIAIQPDGRYAWMSLEGVGAVAVLDTKSQQLVKTITFEGGEHLFAFTPDSRIAYVASRESNTIVAVDLSTLTTVKELRQKHPVGALAYSPASGFIYAAAYKGSSITVLDPHQHTILKQIPMPGGAIALRFTPDGRFGLVINDRRDTVVVLDPITNTILGSGKVAKRPDQLTFTRRYAYLRGSTSEQIELLDLRDVAKGVIAPAKIQSGQRPSVATRYGPQLIVPTPDGEAAMIANNGDQTVYYYMEGMMASAGSFNNDHRSPIGLFIINRGLKESAPGVYSVPVRLARSGRYDVPFVAGHDTVHCFTVTTGLPQLERAMSAPSVQPLFPTMELIPNHGTALRFRVTDPTSHQPVVGLGALQLLVLTRDGTWQQRQWSTEENGIYEVTQVFPHEGQYIIELLLRQKDQLPQRLYHGLLSVGNRQANPAHSPAHDHLTQ